MKKLLVLLTCLFIGTWGQAQEVKDSLQTLRAEQGQITLGMRHFDSNARDHRGIRVVFYNVENLFDIEDDPQTRDEDFTPNGKKNWTVKRYNEKLQHIYQTITAVGGWEAPTLVGLCEIENRKVLEDLIEKTPLHKYGYKIAHKNSADRRGIDVALLYRPDKFELLHIHTIRPKFPFDEELRTRDILQVSGRVLGQDTLHTFVNHWPSRRGGQLKSEPKRTFVAALVRQQVDSLLHSNSGSKILIMGDFNDEPKNKSMSEVLMAKGDTETLQPGELYNFMLPMLDNWLLGTHKYRAHWGILDQVVISDNLLPQKAGFSLQCRTSGASIFSARFLFEEDTWNYGLRPFRTYGGPNYLGGFSDHLPVFIDLVYPPN